MQIKSIETDPIPLSFVLPEIRPISFVMERKGGWGAVAHEGEEGTRDGLPTRQKRIVHHSLVLKSAAHGEEQAAAEADGDVEEAV